MNVLSLFNGMNTGRLALEKNEIKISKYYSSEIKKSAIQITQHYYPDTIQLGDVNNWRKWQINWGSIDLILSGSPCQDLSAAGKRIGLNGKKSILFFVFVEILEHIKKLNPKILFLQENVGSAISSDVGIMSRALGVYPCRLNSKLLTAQIRDRYYWSNIKTKKTMFDLVTDIPLPKDKKIFFSEIITGGKVTELKAKPLLEGDNRQYLKNDLMQHIYLKKRIEKKKQVPNIVITENFLIRPINKIEMCRLQGFPDNYCDILTIQKASSLLGDGWTLPIIEHIFSYIKK